MINQSTDYQFAYKVRSSLSWAIVGKLSAQVVNWGITLYVIRLLTPQDYGLMAMAMILIPFLFLVSEIGLSTAIIQADEITDIEIKKIFGIVLLIHAFLYFTLLLVAPLVARFFDTEELTPLIRLLALLFIVAAFTTLPLALMSRNLQFGRITIGDLIANLVGGLFILLLAFQDFGVWALAYGGLITALVKAFIYNIFCPSLYLPILSVSGIGRLLRFGGTITIERLLWCFYSEADIFIIGKFMGSDTLGIYSVGRHLAALPSEKISPIINQVLLPAFSRIQKRNDHVGSTLVTGINVLSMISFPIFFGIAAVAPELISVILGEKWASAAIVISFFALIIPLRNVSGMVLTALKGIGRPDVSLKNMMLASVLMPAGFLVGVQWGLWGISIAWIISYPICFLVTIYRSAPVLGYRPAQVFTAMLGPLLASLAMLVAIFLLRSALNNLKVTDMTQMTIFIPTGVMIYLLMIYAIKKQDLIHAWQLITARKRVAI